MPPLIKKLKLINSRSRDTELLCFFVLWSLTDNRFNYSDTKMKMFSQEGRRLFFKDKKKGECTAVMLSNALSVPPVFFLLTGFTSKHGEIHRSIK